MYSAKWRQFCSVCVCVCVCGGGGGGITSEIVMDHCLDICRLFLYGCIKFRECWVIYQEPSNITNTTALVM